MGFRLGEQAFDAIFDSDVLVADPAVVKIIELVVVLHRSWLLTRGSSICSGLLVITTGTFIYCLLLGLPLDLLSVVGLFLMAAILLDWSQRIVEFQSCKHRFDQIFKAMATDIDL